jgi:hypothetical protein
MRKNYWTEKSEFGVDDNRICDRTVGRMLDKRGRGEHAGRKRGKFLIRTGITICLIFPGLLGKYNLPAGTV